MDYVIVDLETTGGPPENEAITEIAAYRYNGNEITDRFISLVNPERPIHWYVKKLTGINNKMLRRAPKFYEIAKRIIEITENAIFVAHNADFDYRVLKKEFERLGYKFERPKLCTVKLSKFFFPEQTSYSLGKLCKDLRIPISNRHRASGDALATLELFKLILNHERNLSEKIEIPGISLIKKIPKNLIKQLDELPYKKGIIYLYNKYDHLIAVYNTRNIKKKVNDIYIKNHPKALDLQREINKIDYELIQGELINRVITWHYRYTKNPIFTPCNKKNYKCKKHFPNANMLLIDKGHHTGEKSIIYIKNQQIKGYGFFELEWQKKDIETIKQRLTPVKNHPFLQKIIIEYIQKHKLEKIIHL